MAQHGGHFLFAHGLQQAGRDGHQGVVAKGTRGKCVGRTLVDGHFGATDAGTVCELMHSVDQPGLTRIGRALWVDHLRSRAHFCHRFAHEQRDERAGKADDGGEDQQLVKVQAVCSQVATDPKHVHGSAQDEQHGEVGQKEQEDALHGLENLRLRARCFFEYGGDGALEKTTPVQIRWFRASTRRTAPAGEYSIGSPPRVLVSTDFRYIKCSLYGCFWPASCLRPWGPVSNWHPTFTPACPRSCCSGVRLPCSFCCSGRCLPAALCAPRAG